MGLVQSVRKGTHVEQVIWHDASHSQWQEYVLEIGEMLHIFPSGTQSMGDRGYKKAYRGPRTRIHLQTKFGCDRSIMVGCRSQNDRQTDRQTEWNDNKAHSVRCEHDAILAGGHLLFNFHKENNTMYYCVRNIVLEVTNTLMLKFITIFWGGGKHLCTILP